MEEYERKYKIFLNIKWDVLKEKRTEMLEATM